MDSCLGQLVIAASCCFQNSLIFLGFKTSKKNPLKNIKQLKNIFEFEVAKTAQEDRGKNMHDKKIKMHFETNGCCSDSQNKDW